MMCSTNSRCAISSRSRRADAQRLQEEVALHLQVAPGHDVVEHAHALEQRQALEGARDAHLGHLVRVHVLEGLAAEGDRALLRLVDAVDAVEHRALAGAVGADDGAHLVLAHVEADVGQRLHAAEAQARCSARRGRRRRCGAPAAPCGALARASSRRHRRPAHSRGLRTAGRSSRRRSSASARDAAACGRPRTSPAVSMNCSLLPPYSASTSTSYLLADEAAADLARARELAVVGVELLVQDQEAVDLAAGELRRRRRGRR